MKLPMTAPSTTSQPMTTNIPQPSRITGARSIRAAGIEQRKTPAIALTSLIDRSFAFFIVPAGADRDGKPGAGIDNPSLTILLQCLGLYGGPNHRQPYRADACSFARVRLRVRERVSRHGQCCSNRDLYPYLARDAGRHLVGSDEPHRSPRFE